MDSKALVEAHAAAKASAQAELRHWRSLPDLEADDIANEVVAALLASEIEPENVQAYAKRYALNLVRTRARSSLRRLERNQKVLDDPTRHVEDDNIATMLDQRATATQVTEAMRYGLKNGDTRGVQIIVTWLQLAEEYGEPPTASLVASKVTPTVTRQTVATVLKRFQSYLRAVGEQIT